MRNDIFAGPAWIEWDDEMGCKCPVEEHLTIQVIYLGVLSHEFVWDDTPTIAGLLDWALRENPYEIVGYRIVDGGLSITKDEYIRMFMAL